MNQSLYQLKETFLQEWPLTRIQNMTLEEYTNLDKTSFCYWLEAKTHDLGSIWGGSSYKFGIYKRRDISTTITVDNRITDGEYAWFQKYGTTKEAAFQTVKNTIISIIQNAQNNTLENIDAIDLGDAYKWKIAFLYGNFNVVNIFKNESLLEAAQSLGYNEASKNYSDLNRFIFSNKPSEQDYFDFTAELWKKTSLANSFSEIIENFKSYLEFSETKIRDFTFNEKKKGKNWIWISDDKNIIGKDGFCHYEIITRPKHPKKLWVEIHFEHKKSKQDFYKNLLNDKLSEDFFWNKDHGAGELSLAYSDPIEISDSKINEKIEQVLLILDDSFGNTIRNYALQIDNKKGAILNTPLNQILYGPPGTGKTYNTVLEAAKIVTRDETINYDKALQVFNENLNNQIEFITFHQNYSYEDFIQGLRPDTENGKDLSFEKKDGIFKRIADRALKNLEAANNPASAKKDFDVVFQELIQPLNDGDVEELEIKMKKSSFYITEVGEKSIEFRKNIGDSNHTLSINTLRKMYDKGENDIILGGLQPYYNPILELLLAKGKSQVTTVERKNYVIIIDEINRANISRVFGELITLIEEDKRSHGKIPMRVTLPSGDSFIVPSNLYIIGTMNTADKSISLLDIALRRRFEFVPMYPKTNIEGVNSPTVLETINAEIIKRKGHDFTIGHAYFMGDNYSLEKTINNKVIPLLLEYFMNDEKEVATILKAADIEVTGWPMQMKTA